MKTKTVVIILIVAVAAYFGWKYYQKGKDKKGAEEMKKENPLEKTIDPKERYAGDQFEGNELSEMLK